MQQFFKIKRQQKYFQYYCFFKILSNNGFFIIGHLRSITTTHVTSVARNSRGLNTWHGTKCYTPERGHLNAPNVRVNSRERINSDTSEFLLFTSSIYTFTLNIQFFSRKLSLKKQGHMVFFLWAIRVTSITLLKILTTRFQQIKEKNAFSFSFLTETNVKAGSEQYFFGLESGSCCQKQIVSKFVVYYFKVLRFKRQSYGCSGYIFSYPLI